MTEPAAPQESKRQSEAPDNPDETAEPAVSFARRLVATIITLIAFGSGQALLGRRRRGLIWFASILIWPWIIVLLPWSWFVMPLLWLGAGVDVWLLRPDRERMPTDGRMVVLFVEILLVGGLVLVGTEAWVIERYRIPSAAMVPTLEVGDRIYVSKAAYWFSEPARGDLVVFSNPCEPEKDFIKRVVAVGGDSVEVRCNRLYINGELVPEEPVAGVCTYQDAEDSRRCSRYREALGGHWHDTLYIPERPIEDRLRAEDAARLRYERNAPMHDFPDVRSGSPELPACYSEQSEVLGAFEDSLPERESHRDLFACAPRTRYRVPDGHYFVLGDNRDNSHDSRVWGTVPASHIKGEATIVYWSTSPRDETRWGRIGTRLD